MNPSPFDRPATDIIGRDVELRAKLYRTEQVIGRYETMMVERLCEKQVIQDHFEGRMLLKLTATVYGIDHPPRYLVRYPADWLEALKDRFAPAWFLKRWPALFTEISVSLEETYPGFKPALPGNPPVVKVRVHEHKGFKCYE